MRIPSRLRYWIVGGAVVASLSFFVAISTDILPKNEGSPALAVETNGDDHSDRTDKDQSEGTQYSAQEDMASGPVDYAHPIRLELDALMAGEDQIDSFILRHLEAAEAGNADSAYYLAEAMKYCANELIKIPMSVSYITNDPVGPDEISDLIMSSIVGMPDYYRSEALRHIERAIACQRLGWNSDYLIQQASDWDAFAEKAGQSSARARAAEIHPENVSAERLEESKKTMRAVLKNSRELRDLLYAATVVSASTGSDYKLEILTWALVACEYQSCDSLNYIYRGACEIMALHGAQICTQDMTDMDYLFRKYPSQFDEARARAAEIKQAIDNGQWSLIGLE